MPSSHLILCCPLLLSIFPSIRVFSNESVLCIRWPKYWSFNFSVSPSNEYSGLISFRMDWLDLLAVQGTLKSLHQHYSSKASILRSSAFCIVQLSHPYMITGKNIALTRWTFVGQVMSLLFLKKSLFYRNIVDLQYYISFRCTTQWFNIFLGYNLFKAIIKCWLHSLCCTLHSCIFFILYFSSLYLLIFYVYLAPLPPALPLLVTNLFSLSLFLLHFVSIFRFYI